MSHGTNTNSFALYSALQKAAVPWERMSAAAELRSVCRRGTAEGQSEAAVGLQGRVGAGLIL